MVADIELRSGTASSGPRVRDTQGVVDQQRSDASVDVPGGTLVRECQLDDTFDPPVVTTDKHERRSQCVLGARDGIVPCDPFAVPHVDQAFLHLGCVLLEVLGDAVELLGDTL